MLYQLEVEVYVNDSVIELTALEYRLLLIFANNKGVLLSRQQILDKIWDIDGNFVEDNTLTVYVKRLREKLGEAINIETVRGMGFCRLMSKNNILCRFIGTFVESLAVEKCRMYISNILHESE